jgi:hypothetical protein
MMRSRKVTWAGHVVYMESTVTEYEFFGEKLKGRYCLEVISVYRNMILKCILKKWKKSGKLWTGFIWLRLGACGRLL